MNIDSNQIIGALIGLGLVAKGLAELMLKRKTSSPSTPAVWRGSPYEEQAQEELKKLIHEELHRINDKLIEMLAILRERK